MMLRHMTLSQVVVPGRLPLVLPRQPMSLVARRRRRMAAQAVDNNSADNDAEPIISDRNVPESHPLRDLGAEARSAAEEEIGGATSGTTVEASSEEGTGLSFSSGSESRPLQLSAQPSGPPPGMLDRLPGGQAGRLGFMAVAGFGGLTILIAVVRGILKFRSPRAQRIQKVNKNKVVVESLNRYLPHNREALGKGEVRGLRMKTGFNGVEIFRKYLWYLLRERKFDHDAVADLQQLKTALNLSEDEVAEALKVRSERIYQDYGNVMLETEGMTKGGIERKATCRALFSKLLYLAESEELLPSLDADKRRSLVTDVFGATEDDAAKLRIISLYEVDTDRVDALASEPNDERPPDLSADLDE